MFELLLTACLAGQPGECRTERLPGGETLAACREVARIGARGFPPAFEVQSYPCVAEGTSPDFPVSEIAPGVFVHKAVHAEPTLENRGDLANLSFVIGPEAVAVIDTGSTRAIGAALLGAIRAETELPIRYVILTHMHPDHSLGTAALTEAEHIIAHHRMADALEARREAYLTAMARFLGPAFQGTEIVLPRTGLSAPQDLSLGGDRVLRLTPHATAHTDNDLSVLDRATGTFFAGDLVFHDHLPALDGSILGWIAVLETLMGQPEIARVVPGHGPVALPSETAFTPTHSYLTRLVADTREAIAAGTPMLEAIRTVGIESRADWLLFDVFHPRNVTAAYKELEWE
ncbi:MAG: quinoprotein relay system zinc metallohydrolase 2 [Pseudomonadota bacterium]